MLNHRGTFAKNSMDKCEKCGKAIDYVLKCAMGESSNILLLCKECLPNEPIGFVGNDINGVIFEQEDLTQRLLKAPSIKVCKNCGTSLIDVEKEKKLGCPDCYTLYYETLYRITKGESLTPQSEQEFKNNTINGKIGILEKRMSNAIKEEKYELAAEIRDHIEEIKKQS